jgi:hypothetical protein
MAANKIPRIGSQALDHSSNTEDMQAPLEDSSKDLATAVNWQPALIQSACDLEAANSHKEKISATRRAERILRLQTIFFFGRIFGMSGNQSRKGRPFADPAPELPLYG